MEEIAGVFPGSNISPCAILVLPPNLEAFPRLFFPFFVPSLAEEATDGNIDLRSLHIFAL